MPSRKGIRERIKIFQLGILLIFREDSESVWIILFYSQEKKLESVSFFPTVEKKLSLRWHPTINLLDVF